MAKKIRLRIITPEHIMFDEDTDMVIVRCMTGDMGFLPGHEPCSAILDYGALRLISDHGERRAAIYGGFAQIKDDTLTILTNDAEWPEDIDITQAEADREYAQAKLTDVEDNLEIQSNQVLLRRSLVRIEVSSYPLVNKPSVGEEDEDE